MANDIITPVDYSAKCPVRVRWMIRRDMDDVIDIECKSFEYPWEETDFIRCLRARNCIGMVAETTDGSVVGYLLYELYKTKICIINFAVAYEYRKSGVGRQMVTRLIDKLSKDRRTRLVLDVRETNLQAQLFFSHLGFKATQILKNQYDDSNEDSYHMVYKLTN